MKVIVQLYKDRKAKLPFELIDIDTFTFNDNKLKEYPADVAMYRVLTKEIENRNYPYPLQFWTHHLDANTVCAVLDDGHGNEWTR